MKCQRTVGLGFLGMVGGAMLATAQQTATPQAQAAGSGTHAAAALTTNNLPAVVVISKRLDTARDQIVPSLGATKYTVNTTNLEVQSQGRNATFDQTMLRFPGVVQDELDKRLHVRGEEANLQYRINDILLPDGLLGFGQELNTKFVDTLSLITGTLPAQYGGRTAGIVDIKTKSGTDQPGGGVSVYGGSYGTLDASLEYAGTRSNFAYYVTADYLHTSLGMANPTASRNPTHDDSDQSKEFANLSYVLDDSSRVNLIVSYSQGNFEIPDIPGQTPVYTYAGHTAFDSAHLDENQQEQSFYEVLTYQKTFADLDLQLSQFTRASEVRFSPDVVGDLLFNGVASRVDHTLFANGLTGDAKYDLNNGHILRGGFSFTAEQADVNTLNWVFPGDAVGYQALSPYTIVDDNSQQAYQYSAYLQDEWALTDRLTFNYGLRFDGLNAYLDQYALSPRASLVYQVTDDTTAHIGYAHCFTPPPLYYVSGQEIQRFAGTTHASDVTNSSPVKAEQYHYFDAGITKAITREFHVGLDAYYKIKRDVLDEGQFGPAMIFSPYNAARGRVYGAELTMNYELRRFSAYANFSFSRAVAEGLTSGQFQFDPGELAYLENHWYHLDHDQRLTAATGVSYKILDRTTVYADAIAGTGMYTGFANTEDMPNYATANLGVKQDILDGPDCTLSIRFDVVNVFDKVYEIRDGDGVGVFAPQYLPRRGFYGGVACTF
jgi:outer membrane receptor protein involved in Fe transport